jgi:hypothetical protein
MRHDITLVQCVFSTMGPWTEFTCYKLTRLEKRDVPFFRLSLRFPRKFTAVLSFLFLWVRLMFSVAWTGREEPDPDYELLADANMDRPPSQVERLRFRGYQSHQGAVPKGLETRHRSLQQVSPDTEMSHSLEWINREFMIMFPNEHYYIVWQ